MKPKLHFSKIRAYNRKSRKEVLLFTKDYLKEANKLTSRKNKLKGS